MKDPFTGQMLQRAAEKVKTFGGSEEYVGEPQDSVSSRLKKNRSTTSTCSTPSTTLCRGMLGRSEGCGMKRSL